MAEQEVDVEGVVRKIQKLQKHAEGAAEVGNLEEAANYAGMINKLLLQYQLEATDVQMKDFTESQPVGKEYLNWREHGRKAKKKRCHWQEGLANVVAEAFSCKLVVISGSDNLCFVGRESKRKLAIFTFVTLARGAEKLAQKAYDTFYYACEKEGERWKAKGYKDSFLLGFCVRIQQRFKEELSKATAEHSNAIVLVSKEKKAIDDFMKANKKDYSKGSNLARYGDHNPNGDSDGKKTADAMDLHAGRRAVDNDGTGPRPEPARIR